LLRISRKGGYLSEDGEALKGYFQANQSQQKELGQEKCFWKKRYHQKMKTLLRGHTDTS